MTARMGSAGGGNLRSVWDSLFDLLSALLWRPTERRPRLALLLWLLVALLTFAALTLYLVLR
jgi:hypothetical protein